MLFLNSMITTPSHLQSIAAYTPGASPEQVREQYGLTDVEKLASNENPLGPSPLGAAAAHLSLTNAHIYADGGLKLRMALAKHHGVTPDHITVHNGSDAIIHQIMRTFLSPGDTALSCKGGFVSFGIAVSMNGNEPSFVPLTADYRFDVEALAAAITDRTKIVYIPNPNNPTGTYITKSELTWLLDRIPEDRIVILDEAYHEYAAMLKPEDYPDAISLARPNVIALRTFSKAYGLAGLRIGYGVGHPDVMHHLIKTKLPFDPNAVGCAAAMAALADTEFVQRTTELNAQGLALFHSTLRECGYTTSSSVGNFVMVDCGSADMAKAFHHDLLQRGFITRPLAGFGLPQCVRISTGTTAQNERLAAVLRTIAPNYTSLIAEQS
ncbi:histidinol-phosphate transaminase [soil metagenome]